MGEAAWRALGEVAQLPAWNRALASLGERYVAVENAKVREQASAHLETAAALLRAFARHVAVAAERPDLFLDLEAVNNGFEVPGQWATSWWEVPFAAVIERLRAHYAEFVDDEMLELLDGCETLEELRQTFHARGIRIEPNPYDTTSQNTERLKSTLAAMHDLRRLWADRVGADQVSPEPPQPPNDLGASSYLYLWSEAEVVECAQRIIGDGAFAAACNGCATVDEVRERLGLEAAEVEIRREERLRHAQETERRRRTFQVAGGSFEVGAMGYGELFERLSKLDPPEGPRAEEDDFTPLANVGQRAEGAGGSGARMGKTSQSRPTAELREVVGVVGEMHAYRYLRARFGTEAVNRDAWVSETRLRVLPPVHGEPEDTSDGYGFDFKFRHQGKTWHVEVKATQGEDSQFELGISEIDAASRLARTEDRPWRLLRISNALSAQPRFEWLPNPFQEGARKHFRLRKGGMIVSYSRLRP